MTEIERILNELGIRPAPAPKPERPQGQPADWKGIWYRDGNIPH
ncbi:hypothetical protein [Nostoc phage Nsp-JY18]